MDTPIAKAVYLKHKRFVRWAVILLALFTITGFLVLPPIIKSVLTDKLSENLHRQVTIGSVKFNPYMLSVTLDGFSIKEKDGSGTFVSFDRLYINLQSMSLVKRGIVLGEVRLVKPYISVTRNMDNTYNFSDLLTKKKEEKESKPLKFAVSNIQITGGRVDFNDKPVNAEQKVTDIDVAVPFVSNFDYYLDTFVQPHFSANLNGRPVELKGETKIFSDSLKTNFHVKVDNFNLVKYLEYVPVKLNFKIPSGLLDVNADLAFEQFKKRKMPAVTFSGAVALKKFEIRDLSGAPLLSLPRVGVDIRSADLVSRRVKVELVTIDSPELHVIRDKNGGINLMSLAKTGGEEKPAPAPKAEPAPKPAPAPAPQLVLDVNLLRLSGGSVSFSDFSNPLPFKALIKPIEMTMVNFSSEPGWKSSIIVDMTTDTSESVHYKGGVTISPVSAEGHVELSGVPLSRYEPYYGGFVLFDIVSGRLDLSTEFDYSTDPVSPSERVYNLDLKLSSLNLRKKAGGAQFLNLPLFTVGGAEADMLKSRAVVARIAAEGLALKVKRQKDGSIDLLSLVKKPSGRKARREAAPRKPAPPPWEALIKDFSAQDWSVGFQDLTPARPVNVALSGIKVSAQDISNAKGSKGAVSFACVVNKKGTVQVKGPVGINPVAADLELNVKNIDVVPFMPYAADKLNVTLTSGKVSTGGRLSLAHTPKAITARFKGEAFANGFKILEASTGEGLLNWNSLFAKGIDVGYNPGFATVNEVALTDFYTKIIIKEDKTLNLQNIMKKKPEEAAAAQKEQVQPAKPQPVAAQATPAKSEFPVRINKVTVQAGDVNFTDRSIQPIYTADLKEIAGRVTGLSSEATKMGDLDVKCKFNGHAPLEITGKVNPLREDLYVDLKARFTDMDLNPLTPYSGKYLGYTIRKGKLSFDLKYLIDKKKLDSTNNIFIDQLYLGDKVESPDATKMPVKLAIALLRDRNGEIHLDVPVTGRTDDPKFSIFGIVLKVIWNVIVKAITSPFALLGSLFGGGGEELGYAVFDYGSAVLSDTEAAKLEKLDKALYNRPALKLSIEGHVDPDKDREGLRQAVFEKELKVQKLNDLIDEGKPAVPVDQVTIAPDEYEKYLKMAYKAAKFPKPRNFIGMLKKLPKEEMEKLMLTHIEVTDNDLKQLAGLRAERVKDYLLGLGDVDPGRVFLVEPKELAPEKKEGVKDSRAVFILD